LVTRDQGNQGRTANPSCVVDWVGLEWDVDADTCRLPSISVLISQQYCIQQVYTTTRKAYRFPSCHRQFEHTALYYCLECVMPLSMRGRTRCDDIISQLQFYDM